uniref:Uncharacterized protein n=1 Tax=Sphaerodactylus townsendi TaxID=933632 RepID=A0ACB8ELR0_9SAUR
MPSFHSDLRDGWLKLGGLEATTGGTTLPLNLDLGGQKRQLEDGSFATASLNLDRIHHSPRSTVTEEYRST